MTPTDLESVARDLRELRVEVERVLGHVLARLNADRAGVEDVENARQRRDVAFAGAKGAAK